jgi:beta-phosphoglucomutase-like phosphatase (HAD superfamily)
VQREGIAVKKGAYEILHYLQDAQVPFCLATNSPEANARECLSYAGMSDVFEILVCRDHVPQPKPAADIFLRAASRMQQSIQSCLVSGSPYFCESSFWASKPKFAAKA